MSQLGTSISNVPGVVPFKSAQGTDQTQQLRELAIQVGQPPLRCVTTLSAPTGSSITYTIQVVNSAKKPCTGYFMLDVFVATTPGGIAQDGQTARWVKGVVQRTIMVNGWWNVLTASDGTAKVTLTGSGQRIIHAKADNPHDPSTAGVLQ